jgi:hypothetical protein
MWKSIIQPSVALLISALIVTFPILSFAENYEYVCESDVFYSWKAQPAPSPSASKAMASTNEEQNKPKEVFYTKAGATGHTEEDAKKNLASVLEQVKADALTECKIQHSDSGRCFASGLKTMGKDYQFADYAARHMLLEGIRQTCQDIAGNCLETKSGEVSCYENRPATIPKEDSTAADAKSGKDEKKKKK